MPRDPGLADYEELSLAEKVLRLQDLWDQISATNDSLPLTGAQAAELERRLKAHRSGVGKSSPWSEVRERLHEDP
ncbi:MAG TPA: addiction module protein [Planctomycetota bacterium]